MRRVSYARGCGKGRWADYIQATPQTPPCPCPQQTPDCEDLGWVLRQIWATRAGLHVEEPARLASREARTSQEARTSCRVLLVQLRTGGERILIPVYHRDCHTYPRRMLPHCGAASRSPRNTRALVGWTRPASANARACASSSRVPSHAGNR